MPSRATDADATSVAAAVRGGAPPSQQPHRVIGPPIPRPRTECVHHPDPPAADLCSVRLGAAVRWLSRLRAAAESQPEPLRRLCAATPKGLRHNPAFEAELDTANIQMQKVPV